MKIKRFVSVCTAALLVFASILMSSCSNRVSIKYSGEGFYTDSKNGVTYIALDAKYEPVATGEEYATLKLGDEKISLYKVKDLDPKEGLCDENGQMFCNKELKVPTLENFAADKFYICKTVILTAAISTVTETDAVMRLVEQFTEGVDTEYSATEVLRSYYVKFTSPKYPAFFYNLAYIEYKNDICRYVDIDDPETYVPDVSDSRVKVTYEQYPKVMTDEDGKIVTDGEGKPVYEKDGDGKEIMVWCAVYNYGSNFLYDRDTGRFVPVWNLVNMYL